MLSKKQWSNLTFWIVIIVITEIIMFLLNNHLSLIYLIIALLFLVGFALRILNLYRGKDEPLILDFSAGVISLLFASFAEVLKISNLRFILILISSLIILPHLIYIITNKNI